MVKETKDMELYFECNVCRKKILPPERVSTVHLEHSVDYNNWDLCEECALKVENYVHALVTANELNRKAKTKK